MSKWSEKAAKTYIEDCMTAEEFVKEFPDICPPEHPLPWCISEAGNGHSYFYDKNKIKFAHVYCYYAKDIQSLDEKVYKINLAHQKETGLIDSKDFIKKDFDKVKHSLPWKDEYRGLRYADIFDANGDFIAYVYSKTEGDYMDLDDYLMDINGEED